MTEAAWLNATQPREMLEYLGERASVRKLRLFICACCRGVAHLLTDTRSRKAVVTAEQFADGLAEQWDLRRARGPARSALDELQARLLRDPSTAAYLAEEAAAAAAFDVLREDMPGAVNEAVRSVQLACWHEAGREPIGITPEAWLSIGYRDLMRSGIIARDEAFRQGCLPLEEARRHHADLLRDIFGNPFRRTLIAPAWQDGTVHRLAEVIYEERRFADLPLLADALQDAGCQEEAVLAHCQTTTPHVRGCWLIDALLGKS